MSGNVTIPNNLLVEYLMQLLSLPKINFDGDNENDNLLDYRAKQLDLLDKIQKESKEA